MMRASVIYQVNPKAKRISLRVDSTNRRVIAVMPHKRYERKAHAFVKASREWIERKIAQLPPAVPFHPGRKITLLDQPVMLLHERHSRPGLRREREQDVLVIGGPEEVFELRARRALVTIARREFIRRIDAFVEDGCEQPAKLRVTDTRSRWGSCSETGTISLSWRLIFAPVAVMDYVILHELCHLRHLNHSDAYWREVEKFDKNYQQHRAWLRKHGNELLAIG